MQWVGFVVGDSHGFPCLVNVTLRGIWPTFKKTSAFLLVWVCVALFPLGAARANPHVRRVKVEGLRRLMGRIGQGEKFGCEAPDNDCRSICLIAVTYGGAAKWLEDFGN